MSTRPPREALHMMTAHLWAQRSTCKRAKVGAVITSSDMRRVLSIGYNGGAQGLPNDKCRDSAGTCGCMHAEDNAIILAGVVEANKFLFCTASPCEMCAQRIVNAGIVSVWFLHEYRDKLGIEVLKSCKIPVYQMDFQELIRLLTPMEQLYHSIRRQLGSIPFTGVESSAGVMSLIKASGDSCLSPPVPSSGSDDFSMTPPKQ